MRGDATLHLAQLGGRAVAQSLHREQHIPQSAAAVRVRYDCMNQEMPQLVCGTEPRESGHAVERPGALPHRVVHLDILYGEMDLDLHRIRGEALRQVGRCSWSRGAESLRVQ